ncbi:MAG: hypothetical protein FWH48_00370, partial [Oscillospiraceae bacterium]|nr:hypothetical protein [Oscillospiraceae bacterium]
PPYRLGDKAPGDCVKKLIKNKLLSSGALVICETGNNKQLVLDPLEGIENTKIYKYGSIYITILKTKSAKAGEKKRCLTFA